MRNLRSNLVCLGMLAIVFGLVACGSVNSTTGNDVPDGPAVPIASSGNPCTHDGTGISLTVMPAFDTGAAIQGAIDPTAPSGIDTEVPFCYDFATQQPSAPATLLTQTIFTVKDGVLQNPPTSTIQIVTQWFEWGEPTPGTCTAEVVAVVNVTADSMPACSATLKIGSYVDAPIGSYTLPGP